MQARSALFDLYGDYLRPRGGRAAVAALVRLLAPLEIASPAVRTAISRMVAQGWLTAVRVPAATGYAMPGYQLSPRAVQRLDDAAARIYRTDSFGSRAATWDGHFDLLVFTPPADRGERTRLAATLSYLGYGSLEAGTWVAPRPGDGVDAVLAEAGVRHDRFSARHDLGTPGAHALVRRAWNLASLGEEYTAFVAKLRPVVEAVRDDSRPEVAYAARFRLVHTWRTFLFSDPALPAELLPPRWPGEAAAAFFDQHSARLRPAADAFVDECLTLSPLAVPVGTRTVSTLPRSSSDD